MFCKKNVPGLNCIVKERSSLVMGSTSQAFTELELVLGNETESDQMRISQNNYTSSHYTIVNYFNI